MNHRLLRAAEKMLHENQSPPVIGVVVNKRRYDAFCVAVENFNREIRK